MSGEPTASVLSRVLGAELVVARAGFAARNGRLDEAADLLNGLADRHEHPEALDLLARVNAQRGALDEADDCWARVQALASAGSVGAGVGAAAEDAAAGRRLIARIRAGERRPRPLLAPGRVAVGAGLLTGTVLVAILVWPRAAPVASAPPPEGPAAAAALAPAPASAPAVASAPASGPAPAPDVRALAERLAMPGVRVAERSGQVRVVFDDGLFSGGDRLSEPGAAALQGFGRRLAGAQPPITVVGHTVTVPGGPTAGGSVVGMARALVAARELSRASGLPLTAFTLTSADQSDVPFPEPDRNRTVTLFVPAPSR